MLDLLLLLLGIMSTLFATVIASPKTVSCCGNTDCPQRHLCEERKHGHQTRQPVSVEFSIKPRPSPIRIQGSGMWLNGGTSPIPEVQKPRNAERDLQIIWHESEKVRTGQEMVPNPDFVVARTANQTRQRRVSTAA